MLTVVSHLFAVALYIVLILGVQRRQGWKTPAASMVKSSLDIWINLSEVQMVYHSQKPSLSVFFLALLPYPFTLPFSSSFRLFFLLLSSNSSNLIWKIIFFSLLSEREMSHAACLAHFSAAVIDGDAVQFVLIHKVLDKTNNRKSFPCELWGKYGGHARENSQEHPVAAILSVPPLVFKSWQKMRC